MRYEYKCSECQNITERFTSITNMYEPEKEPCMACGKIAVKKVILTAPSLGDPVRLGLRKPDDGFKEVLQKIHDNTPGSKVKESSSFI